jgi:hypothetical protein
VESGSGEKTNTGRKTLRIYNDFFAELNVSVGDCRLGRLLGQHPFGQPLGDFLYSLLCLTVLFCAEIYAIVPISARRQCRYLCVVSERILIR